jgi:hypothetical protein
VKVKGAKFSSSLAEWSTVIVLTSDQELWDLLGCFQADDDGWSPSPGRVLAVVATLRFFGSCNDRVVFNEGTGKPEEVHA